jgi:pimeloyl-ACP methyl ester carboxylesterase
MSVRGSELRVGEHRVEVRWTPQRLPHRPTLVLLHEALGCVRRWKEWPAQLAAATGCAVFAYSRPGHGRSSAAPGTRPHDYLHREALEVLPAVLRAANVGPRILVGHSDGASIATIYAGTIADPGLLGVVQLAPHFVVEDEALTGIRDIVGAWGSTNLRRRLAKYHGPNTGDLFRQWTETWLDPAFRSWNITAELEGVPVPTLLVQGAADQYGSEAQFDIARRVARCRLSTLMLPEVGHSPHLDAPEVTTTAVSGFVASLMAPTTG